MVAIMLDESKQLSIYSSNEAQLESVIQQYQGQFEKSYCYTNKDYQKLSKKKIKFSQGIRKRRGKDTSEEEEEESNESDDNAEGEAEAGEEAGDNEEKI